MKAKIQLPLLTAILLLAANICTAKDDKKHKTYLNPDEVDADYQIQGEYTGKIEEKKTGAQVVALGDGKFSLVIYPGGLPGDGWDGDKKNRIKTTGSSLGATFFKTDDYVAKLHDGKIEIQKPSESKVVGQLTRITRKSPTLGMAPPEGAVILFDGKNTNAWKAGAKMGEDGLLHQGATSKQEFRDFSLHLEFRTPYKPTARGQARGNSGFYAQGRYEVQILDTFGLEGAHNECGGIYKIAEPKMNLCYPPLTWQTYDVDFTAAKFDAAGKKTDSAKITVKHNGIVIHDNLTCSHATTASPKKEEPSPGPVYLQNHSNPVRYRNVWVVEK